MENLKVIKVSSDSLEFDNGMILSSDHEQNCCESHFLSLKDLTLDDFKGLKFDLSNDDFFERIENYGIALKPKNGHPVRIPGYGYNNGYYSDNLALTISNTNGIDIFKKYDITNCQKWEY
jgi:hypothetical protein